MASATRITTVNRSWIAAGTSYGEQLERAVARDPRAAALAEDYREAVAVVQAAPRTVIHGEAFPSNVLVTPQGDPCVVDWETAGYGCGLIDLAALTAGWAPAAAWRIAAAYGGDLAALPAARLVVAVRGLGERTAHEDAGGGQGKHTDWWAEAAGAKR